MKIVTFRRVLCMLLGTTSAIVTGAVVVSCAQTGPSYQVHQPASAPTRSLAPVGSTPLLGDIPLAAELLRQEVDQGNVIYQELTPGFQSRRTKVAPRPDGRLLASSSCLPPLNEEVWIIQRPGEPNRRPAPSDDLPGCGALMTCLPTDPETQVPVPLKHTDVSASIAGAIASVEVLQQFHNPFDSKIEAVYVFPLPENAAVNEFIMTVGDRHIRGIIREREEAQKIYAEARQQGYVASLLTEERPNIFTQKVANIEPGKQIDISIRYFNTIAYTDGAFEFAFPMVVGPRFNPPPSADARAPSPPAPDVQYLRPNQRSGHDISLTVAIDTGALPLDAITCKSHVVQIQRPSSSDPGRATIRLAESDSIPNKDFVLRYTLAGPDTLRTSVVARQSGADGYLSMMFIPPDNINAPARRPLELVFVLDCSGSMSGEPLSQAQNAVKRALRQLGPDDTFQVINFSTSASALGPAPIPATTANIRRGVDYVSRLSSEGGTMMIHGIRAALDFPHDPSRLRFVCFLTDGYIGNEPEILAEIQNRLGASRIFSFGIGSSVNRYLMDSMARVGRGAVSSLAAGESAADTMDAFITRIARAPMTDIRVEFDGLAIAPHDVFPTRIPDLFAGRPVTVNARFTGTTTSAATARISGDVAGERVTYTVPITINATTSSSDSATPASLAAVWARHKIASLTDAAYTSASPAEIAGSIRQVALQFGLMSPYTAFIAVDSSTRTDGTYGTTVAVPVPVPDGVRYDTTVSERTAN